MNKETSIIPADKVITALWFLEDFPFQRQVQLLLNEQVILPIGTKLELDHGQIKLTPINPIVIDSGPPCREAGDQSIKPDQSTS